MGRADVQNLVARWRRWSLVNGGGKSIVFSIVLLLSWELPSGTVLTTDVVDDVAALSMNLSAVRGWRCRLVVATVAVDNVIEFVGVDGNDEVVNAQDWPTRELDIHASVTSAIAAVVDDAMLTVNGRFILYFLDYFVFDTAVTSRALSALRYVTTTTAHRPSL